MSRYRSILDNPGVIVELAERRLEHLYRLARSAKGKVLRKVHQYNKRQKRKQCLLEIGKQQDAQAKLARHRANRTRDQSRQQAQRLAELSQLPDTPSKDRDVSP